MTKGARTSLEFVFQCPLESGLHARPASHLTEVANKFASECSITNLRNGLVANAKSVLNVIAADIRFEDRCVIIVSGPDEQAAHTALLEFVESALPNCDVPLAEVPTVNNGAIIPRQFRAAGVTCITGIPVSRGIAQGKIRVLDKIALPTDIGSREQSDTEAELSRLKEAISAVRSRISEKLKYAVTPVGVAVLEANLAMAGDVALVERLTKGISQGQSVAQAVVEAGEFFVDLFLHSENEYVRQRSADVEEICLQLLEEVGGIQPSPPLELTEPSVVVAETLAPQQILGLHRDWLKALVLENSGTTSHAAILARSLGIPTVAAVRNAHLVLTSGREVMVDGDRGIVIPSINPDVRRFYDREQKTQQRRREKGLEQALKVATTSEGRRLEVAANATSAEETTAALENGADGIGLFRTEMIFLGREEPPSEEEQFAIYSETAKAAAGRPVIIRTFDIGGDKRVPYLNQAEEENPFLGYRGARLYAEHQELLLSQLRAILRASRFGSIQVMAPMISSLHEVVQFKASISRAQEQLRKRGFEFQTDISIGIMIEVPALAFLIDQLSAEVEFFSLGTNDLSQYFYASDRTNPKVSSLLSVREPSFLRLLSQIVEGAHKSKKWIGMCGEMASDLSILPLLIGLGLDEISVIASEIPEFKRSIGELSSSHCTEILQRALHCESSEEVESLLAGAGSPAEMPLLTEELILIDSLSQTKAEVIQEMVDTFYVSGRTNNRQTLEEALWAREALGSTEVGYGFAIPHCKSDALTANSICVLRLKEPIDWNSAHPERVRMVILLALRESDRQNTHMQVFSSLARKLINDDFRHSLLGFKDSAATKTFLSQELDI